jgi:aspartokinase
MANFGANILHAKTIIPIIGKNTARILNTFNHENKGTLLHPTSELKNIVVEAAHEKRTKTPTTFLSRRAPINT